MLKMKKFKLTENTKQVCLTTLHRIIALKDFHNVKKGDLVGWVEKESNLSQEGNCWIYDNGYVYDNAIICGNVTVSDNVKIHWGASF